MELKRATPKRGRSVPRGWRAAVLLFGCCATFFVLGAWLRGTGFFGRTVAWVDQVSRALPNMVDGLLADPPRLVVRTYSTHYGKESGELPTYAAWYREHEQPGMTDAEFLAADDYVLELSDFLERFGVPRRD